MNIETLFRLIDTMKVDLNVLANKIKFHGERVSRFDHFLVWFFGAALGFFVWVFILYLISWE